MASFVLFIFTLLLLPVSRSADVQKCYICEGDNWKSCIEPKDPIDCAEKSTCLGISSSSTLSIEHPAIDSFSRKCVTPSNYLNGSFYFDFGNKTTLEFNSQDCNGTKCSFQTFRPPIRMYENGKSCPRCFRTGSMCEEDGKVLCVGDLGNCVEVNGEITHKYSDLDMTTTIPFSGKGCVSQSVCNIGSDKSLNFGSFVFKFKSIQCSEANGALSTLRHLAFALGKKDLGAQVAFFFPCILGIFAVKILS